MKKVYEYRLFLLSVFVTITLLILLFVSKNVFISMIMYIAFPVILGSVYWLLTETNRDCYKQQKEFLKEIQQQYGEVIDNIEWALKASDFEILSSSEELGLELQEISNIIAKVNNKINNICKEVEDLKYKDGKEKEEVINSIKKQLNENWKHIRELERIVYLMG